MADVGGADGSDDEQVELAQEQEAATPDIIACLYAKPHRNNKEVKLRFRPV